jgi:hypothetical protein
VSDILVCMFGVCVCEKDMADNSTGLRLGSYLRVPRGKLVSILRASLKKFHQSGLLPSGNVVDVMHFLARGSYARCIVDVLPLGRGHKILRTRATVNYSRWHLPPTMRVSVPEWPAVPYLPLRKRAVMPSAKLLWHLPYFLLPAAIKKEFEDIADILRKAEKLGKWDNFM